MAAKFHINTKTGKVSRCRATGDGCPFGGENGTENHYATESEARSAYEASMSDQVLPTAGKPNAQVGQTELNKRAKTATLEGDQLEIAELGSERVLSSLAGNADATESALIRAYERAEKEETKEKIEDHPNYPVIRLSQNKLMKLSRYHGTQGIRLTNYAKSNDVDDAGAEKLRVIGNTQFMLNHDNQVSDRVRLAALVNADEFTLSSAANDPKIVNPKTIPGLWVRTNMRLMRYMSGADSIRAGHKAIMAKRIELDQVHLDRYRSNVVSNPSTPSDVLESVVDDTYEEYGKMNDSEAVSFYRHRNASPALKAKLGDNPAVKPLKRLDDLRSSNPKEYAKLNLRVGRDNPTPLPRKARAIQLNPYAIERLGMSEEDVHTYVRHERNQHLWNASYNQETGEYIGYID